MLSFDIGDVETERHFTKFLENNIYLVKTTSKINIKYLFNNIQSMR